MCGVKDMQNKNTVIILLLILMVFRSSYLAHGADERTALPESYLISDVPYHEQITGLSCGPAALEMLYDFWGEDIDQKAIADVTRSSSVGTYTWDMVRAGFFSHMSSAQGRFFPRNASKAGYSERPLGYASFAYSSDTFWWTDLKELIAQDIPVVLFMRFAPDDDTAHYRVIVGYNEEEGVVYFLDPWSRDLDRMTNHDRTITWSMADFESAWNYTGYGTSRSYWGTVMMPWTVAIHTNGGTTAGSVLGVTAEVTYPCPQPFDCSASYALDTFVEIILPPNMHLLEGSSRSDIGYFQAGESVTITWKVKLDTDGTGSSFTVKATGLVSGTVPEINWMDKNGKKSEKADNAKKGNKNFYPAYTYTDEIGVEKTIEL
jgi:hypothetical protein